MVMSQCSFVDLEFSGLILVFKSRFLGQYNIFSDMVITHDMRSITRRPDATLSEQQRKVLNMIGNLIKILIQQVHSFSLSSPRA